MREFETKGAAALAVKNLTFEQLADRYHEAKMMEAEGGRDTRSIFCSKLLVCFTTSF